MIKYNHMLFEKIFSGGHSSKEMHSNQYAVGSVSQRTFSQRKAIEQKRSRIAAYRQSKLGWSVAPRSAYKKPEQNTTTLNVTETPRSINSPTTDVAPAPPPRSFQEPGGRNFNPYS